MQKALFNPLRTTLRAGMAARTAAVRPAGAGFVRFNSTDAKKDASEPAAEEAAAEPAAEETSPEAQALAQCQTKLEKKDKDLAAMKQHYQRAVADFRSLQELTKKDVQKAKDFALQKFAKDLLELVDNFGRAMQLVDPKVMESNSELKALYDGVHMTKNVFEKTLERYGIEKIDPEGAPFDPNQHEATFEIPQPDKEPGTVFHVQQVGYTLNSRVLRPAKVGVVKGDD